VIVGEFDPASIMLYRFPDIFYKEVPSACAPTGDGITLSDGDKRALTLLYPRTGPETDEIARRSDALLDAITPATTPLPGLETDETGMARRVAAMLRQR
jgi:hypothetical protein